MPFFTATTEGLVEDDAFAAHADQRVAGAQIDAHVEAEPAEDESKNTLENSLRSGGGGKLFRRGTCDGPAREFGGRGAEDCLRFSA